jgi:small subunit ribosomal protein S18
MAEKRKYKKKYCKYCAEVSNAKKMGQDYVVDFIDYKDVEALKHSLSERYKIMPRRLTGNCKRHQEVVSKAIKKARQASLIPYVVDRKSIAGQD